MKEINKTMYVVVDKRGNAQLSTLKEIRKDSIHEFLRWYTTNTKWVEALKYGWKCIKVDVHIMSSSNI